MVTVSVIICTYNQEDTLSRALNAVLAQQCDASFEIIIGEDASRDNTRKVCEEYANKYPNIIRLMPKAPNKGIVDNYYGCIREAQGEYIMECAGDDEWCQGRMQLCLDTIRKHNDVVQVFTQVYYRKDNTGEIIEPNNSLFPFGLLKGSEVIDGMMHQHHNQTVFYAITRRNAILKVMEDYPDYFTGRKYHAEDKQLIVLLGTQGNFVNLPNRTYYYTIDNGSITRSSLVKHFLYGWNMLMMTHNLAKTVKYKGCLWDIYSHIIYNMLTQLVWKSIIKLFPFLHN